MMWKAILEASFTGLFAYGLIKDPRDPIWRKMIFVVMLMGIIHMVFPFPMHLLLDGMALFFFLLFARHQTFGNALMSAMIPCAILAISDTTVLVFFKAFIFDGLSYLEIRENHGMILDFCMLAGKALSLAFFSPMARKIHDQLVDHECYIVFGILATMYYLAVCVWTSANLPKYQDLTAFLTMMDILAISILFLALVMRQHQQAKLDQQEKIKLEILGERIKSSDDMIKMQREMYKMRHDIKHLVNALNQGENKAIIAEYVEKMKDMPSPLAPTACNTLDLILNMKREEASLAGIETLSIINYSHSPLIPNSDFILILSNLMDNAIKHIGSEKKIKIMIKEYFDMLSITIVNSVDGTVDFKDDLPVSSDTSFEHGHGILTISELFERNNGRIAFRQEGNEFIAQGWLLLSIQ